MQQLQAQECVVPRAIIIYSLFIMRTSAALCKAERCCLVGMA
jgi:hypothetical protein